MLFSLLVVGFYFFFIYVPRCWVLALRGFPDSRFSTGVTFHISVYLCALGLLRALCLGVASGSA